MKKEISWGNLARRLCSKDVCIGLAKQGDKRDLRGWIIYFFGEHTRAAIKFEQTISDKIGIPSHMLELWSDSNKISDQIKFFNETLKDLKVCVQKNRSNVYRIHKRFKNGRISKKPKEIVTAENEQKALDKMRSKGYTESELNHFIVILEKI